MTEEIDCEMTGHYSSATTARSFSDSLIAYTPPSCRTARSISPFNCDSMGRKNRARKRASQAEKDVSTATESHIAIEQESAKALPETNNNEVVEAPSRKSISSRSRIPVRTSSSLASATGSRNSLSTASLPDVSKSRIPRLLVLSRLNNLSSSDESSTSDSSCSSGSVYPLMRTDNRGSREGVSSLEYAPPTTYSATYVPSVTTAVECLGEAGMENSLVSVTGSEGSLTDELAHLSASTARDHFSEESFDDSLSEESDVSLTSMASASLSASTAHETSITSA